MRESVLPIDAETDTRRDPYAAIFVWAVWTCMFVGSACFTWKYSVNVPYFDDFRYAYIMTGDLPMSRAWLWDGKHAEMHLPLVRLVYGYAARLTGDFRALVYLNCVTLAVVAALLISAARRQRGKTTFSDAFFPLLVIRLGDGESPYLWATMGHFVMAMCLASVFLVLVVRTRCELTRTNGILAGLVLALLPSCGPQGYALVPALGMWLILASIRTLFSDIRDAKFTGYVTLALVVVAFAQIPLHVIWYRRDSSEAVIDIGNAAKGAVQFLAMSMGLSGQTYWPWSGGIVVLLLVLGAGVSLGVSWQRSEKRVGSLGLLLFLVALCCLALAIGLGRGRGLTLRYSYLAVPALCCVYYIWGLLNHGIGRLAQFILFFATCAPLARDVERSIQSGRQHHKPLATFEKHMQDGVSLSLLIEHHYYSLFPVDNTEMRAVMADVFCNFRRAEIGKFPFLKDDPTELRIDFRLDASANYLGPGWYDREEDFRWSDKEAAVRFYLAEPRPMRLRMLTSTYGHQRIRVQLNGEPVADLTCDGDAPHLFEIPLPGANVQKRNSLLFDLPDARSAIGGSGRVLGLSMVWMEFMPVE